MLEKAKHLLQPSARSAVPPFMVMDVVAAAARLEAQGRRIIHMEVGQPAASAPATAIDAARTALAAARLGYTETLGTVSLRTTNCASLCRMARDRRRSGADRRHHRIVGGLYFAFLAAFNAGDRVAMALPGYPPTDQRLTALGCEPVGIETSAATRWSMTGETLLPTIRKSR